MRPVGRAILASARRRSLLVADQGPFLTPTGSPLFVPGKFGNAMQPNGGSLYADTPGGFGGNISSFTMEAWAYYNGANGGQIVFDGISSSAGNASKITLGFYGPKVWFIVGTFNYNYDSFAVPAGWHHICLMANNGTVRGYLDGIRRLDFGGAGLGLAFTRFRFGAGANDLSSQFPATSMIDEFRFSLGLRYNINATTFTPPTDQFAIDPNTVALYHFERLEA